MSYSWVSLFAAQLQGTDTGYQVQSWKAVFERNCVNFASRMISTIYQPASKPKLWYKISPYQQLAAGSHLSVESRELSSEYRIIKYIILI